jgi:lysophospholipase L1-like esterase
MQYAFGTYWQTGRADALFFASMDTETTNKRNWAVNGSRACIEGASTGGFRRFFNGSKKPQRGGPYVADGGAALFCWGINDLGLAGFTTQYKDAYQHAMRTMISRWRAAVIYENDYLVGTRTSYGAGFGAVAAVGYTSNDTAHWCTATTNANFTLTLPSDYQGETVSICLVGAGGVSGGIVTWSGTAGVTGTTSTSNILPSGAASHCPVIKRITNLTSANAGQTIIGTVNTLDAGGAVMLDYWMLESKNPSPIIVCNVARLTASGYTSNYASWTGTEASRDQDVVDLNTRLISLQAEFDSMVQIADIDSILNKDATLLFSDGLHPNEFGAAAIVDAIQDARKRLRPTSPYQTRNFNVPSPRAGGMRKPRRSGSWHTTSYTTTGTEQTVTVTSPAGTLWAIPIIVSEATEFWNRLAIKTGATGGSASTIRWGIYDDVAWSGYPGEIITEPTSGGALSTGTVANTLIMSPTSGGGSFQTVMDPGLYWVCLLTVTAGATQTWVTLNGDGGGVGLPNLDASGNPYTSAAAMVNSWKATGVATTAMPTSFPTGAALTGAPPYIGVQININLTN